ncbi:MAG: ATP-binding protein [Christensenellales bacterium]
MEIAGGHNILLISPPGSGKTMLAKAMNSILPDLTIEEALEITKIHSVAGQTKGRGLVSCRPFRAPHHSISTAALAGGGAKARPGEVSLAHGGVLFLDELPEFKRDALEALRQPLEDHSVTVSRVNATATYPARLCWWRRYPRPCRQYSTRTAAHPTRSTAFQTVSGPLLNRIDK